MAAITPSIALKEANSIIKKAVYLLHNNSKTRGTNRAVPVHYCFLLLLLSFTYHLTCTAVFIVNICYLLFTGNLGDLGHPLVTWNSLQMC